MICLFQCPLDEMFSHKQGLNIHHLWLDGWRREGRLDGWMDGNCLNCCVDGGMDIGELE